MINLHYNIFKSLIHFCIQFNHRFAYTYIYFNTYLSNPLLFLRIRTCYNKKWLLICIQSLCIYKLKKFTNENYLLVYYSADFIDVIVFNGIIYVGELYTFRYLNVINACGVNTNQRLCYERNYLPPPWF
jgi:hypothetical protein